MRQYLENILPDYFEQSRKCGHERSVLFCGKYIFSYDTCIGVLEKHNSGTVLYLNKTKYSSTTSTLQNAMREYAKRYVDKLYELSGDAAAFNVDIAVAPGDR